MNDQKDVLAIRKNKIVSRLVLAFVFILVQSSVAHSQSSIRNADEHAIRPPVMTDEDEIRFLLLDLVHGVRNKQPIRIARAFAENIDLKQRARGESTALFAEVFSIDSLSVRLSGNRATVDCWIFDRGPQKGLKEVLMLTRLNGGWRISGASKLIGLIADNLFVGGKKAGIVNGVIGALQESSSKAVSVGQMSSPNVSTFVMSSRAVIRRLVPYTSVWSINQDVTQQYLSRRLFLNPGDGEVVIPTGSSDYIAIVADRAWDRIVYGSFNGSWVKSYGDNAGDYKFLLPYGLDIDPSGNIFCIDGIRRVVFKLRYDNTTGAITFAQEFSLSGIVNPMDVDIDPLGEGFWLADREGNAIIQVSNTGQILGKATRAIDVLTGASYSFSAPTKVLCYADYYKYVSLIDFGRKRVITVSGASFQGDALSGYVTTCQFDQQSNVSLSSLGIDFGHGLWATDENNGLLHTFDVANYTNGGYLASIRVTADGQIQWVTPKAFASTPMSGSSSHRLDFLTLDDWSTTSGINSYLPGADFINPYKQFFDWTVYDPTWWGTEVGAVLPARCRLKVDLYRSDGSFIKTKSDGYWTTPASRSGVSVMAGDVGNPIGLFRARFEVTPAFNSSYGQYQQAALVNDVWFSMPLKASLSGPTSVYHPLKGQVNQYAWTYGLTSGAPPFTFVWKKNGYVVGSNSSTYTEYYSYNGSGGGSYQFTLEVTVTDQSSPIQTRSASITVTAYNSGGSGGGFDPSIEQIAGENIPTDFSISQNYPNPFNPETEIVFGLPEQSQVKITISDLLGREILTLAEGELVARYYRKRWTGTDATGKKVGSGIYLCRISAKGESGKEFTRVLKMLLLK